MTEAGELLTAFVAGFSAGGLATAFIIRSALRDILKRLSRKIDLIGCGD